MEIKYSFYWPLSFQVKNSYLITSDEDIKQELQKIHQSHLYQELVRLGFTRTFQSQYEEWKAHNFLYKIGFRRKRTASVDINQGESAFRLFMYKILSRF